MSKFADVVKELLEEKKMTQKELSMLSGVSEPSLCRYISKGVQPRMDIINNVAKAFGVSADYLLGGENRKEKENAFVETRNIITRNKGSLSIQEKAEILKILFDEKK